MSALTCLLCASDCLAARLWMASSLPSDVSEAAIHTYDTCSNLDITMLLWIIARWLGFKQGETLFRTPSRFLASLAILPTKCVQNNSFRIEMFTSDKTEFINVSEG